MRALLLPLPSFSSFRLNFIFPLPYLSKAFSFLLWQLSNIFDFISSHGTTFPSLFVQYSDLEKRHFITVGLNLIL